jgi:hypothetical protein
MALFGYSKAQENDAERAEAPVSIERPRASERRSACSPALPHHSIERSSSPACIEMMRDDFRRRCGALWNIAQNFGRTAVQHLAAALEQAVVGRVLDQRVLEAIVRLCRRALDEKDIRMSEPLERRLQRQLVQCGDVALKLRPSKAPICAASCAGPSRSRRAARDCCKVGGIACAPPSTPRSSRRRVTSSTNSGTPPVRSLTPSTTSCDSAYREASSPTIRATCARSSGASDITL